MHSGCTKQNTILNTLHLIIKLLLLLSLLKGHDSSVGEWMNFTASPLLLVARVQFPAISWDFSLADYTLPTHPDPVWQKMAQSPLDDTGLWAARRKAKIQLWTDDG